MMRVRGWLCVVVLLAVLLLLTPHTQAQQQQEHELQAQQQQHDTSLLEHVIQQVSQQQSSSSAQHESAAEAEAETEAEAEADAEAEEKSGKVYHGVVQDSSSGDPMELSHEQSVPRPQPKPKRKAPPAMYVTKKGEKLYRTYVIDPKKHLVRPKNNKEKIHSKERVLSAKQAAKLTRAPAVVDGAADRYGWHTSESGTPVPPKAVYTGPAPTVSQVQQVQMPAARSLAQTGSTASTTQTSEQTAAAAPQVANTVKTGDIWYAPASTEPAEYALAFAGGNLLNGQYQVQRTNPPTPPPTPQFKLPDGRVAIPDMPQVVTALKKRAPSQFAKRPHAIFSTHRVRHHVVRRHPRASVNLALAARHPLPSVRQVAEVSALRAASRTLRRINSKRRQFKRALRALRQARNRIHRQIHRHHVINAIRSRRRADRLARRAAWSALLQHRRFRRRLRKRLAKAFANNRLNPQQRRRAIVHLLKEAVSERDRKTLHTYLKHLKGRHAALKRVALRKPRRWGGKRAAKKAGKKGSKKSSKKAAKKAAKKASKAKKSSKKAKKSSKKSKKSSKKSKKSSKKASKKGGKKAKSVKKHIKALKKAKSAKHAKPCAKGSKKKKHCPKYRARKPKKAARQPVKKAAKSSGKKENRRPLSPAEEKAAVAELLKRIKAAIHASLPKDPSPSVVKKVKSKLLKPRKLTPKELRAKKRAEKAAIAKKIADAKKKIKSVAKFGQKPAAKSPRFQQLEAEAEAEVRAESAADSSAEAEAEALAALTADAEIDLPEDVLTKTEAQVEAASELTDDWLHEHGIQL